MLARIYDLVAKLSNPPFTYHQHHVEKPSRPAFGTRHRLSVPGKACFSCQFSISNDALSVPALFLSPPSPLAHQTPTP